MPESEIPTSVDYKEKALVKIREAVKGNRFDPEQITINSFDGGVLKFAAKTQLEIRTKVSEKTVPGRQAGPQVVDSGVALKAAVDQEIENLKKSADTEQKIKALVLGRDDKGFALDDIDIPIDFWKKDFVYYEGCGTCKTNGTIQCQRCHGVGQESCPQCHKKGMTPCTQCRGSQQIQGPNGMQPCTQCQGQGDIPCSLCQQRGEVQCRTCKTKGSTTCTACNGNGWNSHITTAQMDVHTHFDYERDGVPDKAVALIQKLGPKLSGHADIEIVQAAEGAEEKEIVIHYRVQLPCGQIGFVLGNESASAFLFGNQVKLTSVSPFLEPILAKGMQKLQDAGAGRGSVAGNLQMAAKYKTLRQAIIAAARYPLKKAVKAVQSGSPLGLSKAKINEMVQNADKALKNITAKPRQQGLIGGLGVSAIAYGAYFFLVRGTILKSLPNEAAHMAIDLMVFAVGAALVIFAIQIVSAKALRTALKGIVPAGKEKAFTAKTGKTGLYASIGAFVIFAVLWALTILRG
ncbi:MAG: hypothetical protein DHS20C02_20630 [Micavibrio sp.]|nr:MAG: hypothetical protein DHS20C02_20630 [Micavibrio sp.]